MRMYSHGPPSGDFYFEKFVLWFDMRSQACYIYSVRTKQGDGMTVEMKVRRMVSEHGRVKTREMILGYKNH